MKVDLSLEQIVQVNRREKICLDQVFTNRPSLANRTEDVVGVSDHAAILLEITTTIPRAKPISRKVFLWSKSNMTEIKAETTRLTTSILHTFSTDSLVEEAYTQNRSKIPSEQTCSKQDDFNETQPTLGKHKHQTTCKTKTASM